MPVFPPFPVGPSQPQVSGAAGPAYAGPGDILATGWNFWAGMRAFSITGNPRNAVFIRFNDTTQRTYQTANDGSGTINLSTSVEAPGVSFSSDLGTHGAPALIVTWFDQSGNGNHILMPGAHQPTFTTGALGTWPGATFSGSQYGGTTNNVNLSQPLGVSLVANITSSAVASQMFISDPISGNDCTVTYNHVPPDRFYIYAGGGGSEQATPITLNAFHAINATFNNTASHLYVDGADNATGAGVGSNGLGAGTTVYIGVASGQTTGFVTGVMLEIGANSGSLLGSQVALNSNQHTVYGF